MGTVSGTAAGLALGSLTLLLAACGIGQPSAGDAARGASGGDILVGAPWPWQAHADLFYGQGLDLAVEQINAAGGALGRRLRLVRADDQESLDRGRLVAQELTRDARLVAVIGHLQSYVTVPAAAIYDLAGVVLISPTSTTPELTDKGYGRVFRSVFSDADVGRAMARYGRERGYARFVIYYARNAYGRGLANAFEEEVDAEGGHVVDRQSYDGALTSNAQAAAQTVAGWVGRDIDAVFIAGQDQQGALLAAELRRRGIHIAILGSDALGTPSFIRVGGSAVDGAVIAGAFHPDDPDPTVRRFVASFRARYGRAPDVGAALGYDAVQLLARGIRDARSAEPARIAAALHALRGFHGVTGTFSFDSAGNAVDLPVHLLVVRDGRLEYLRGAVLAGGATSASAASPGAR